MKKLILPAIAVTMFVGSVSHAGAFDRFLKTFMAEGIIDSPAIAPTALAKGYHREFNNTRVSALKLFKKGKSLDQAFSDAAIANVDLIQDGSKINISVVSRAESRDKVKSSLYVITDSKNNEVILDIENTIGATLQTFPITRNGVTRIEIPITPINFQQITRNLHIFAGATNKGLIGSYSKTRRELVDKISNATSEADKIKLTEDLRKFDLEIFNDDILKTPTVRSRKSIK